ncbi:13402_t:CDS:10 [Ambispora leptoticha]|uniref:13402_t:CDS:1 n=1 Tax=Ambispora leptoticha TaxID=144679 RepID=A0A9N8Z695_9GLOM|nr:13402_t:CDS:10 [Ambispora leptoticha]
MEKLKEKLTSIRTEADAAYQRAETAEDELKKTKAEIISKEQEILSFHNKIALLEAENDRIGKKVTDDKHLQEEVESNKTSTEALQRKIALLENELDNTGQSLHETTEKLRQTDIKAEHFERKVHQLEVEKADLEKKIATLGEELSQKKKELEDTLKGSSSSKMLRSKGFIKRTKKGNAVKVVQEHYLREDIWCSVESCSRCSHTQPILRIIPSNTKILDSPHLIVADTNVFMNQIDIIEHKSIRNVIILQTVYEEIRHLSLPIYNRLKAIINDTSRGFYVFSNEHHRETYTERLKDESPNDRNDRAIRLAVKWYSAHLNKTVKVLLLSDDVANREEGKKDGMLAFSVRQYVEGMVDFPELMDMLSNISDNQETKDKEFTYEEHLSSVHISNGLKNGTLYQGTLNISTHNYLEGSIMANIDGTDTQIMILGRQYMNRAIQGDIVAVKLLPQIEWLKTPTEVIVDEDEENVSTLISKDSNDGETKENNNIEVEETLASTPQPTGDKNTETQVLLLEHDVPHQDFSQQVLSELPIEGETWKVNEAHLRHRVDMRHLNICSIDPPDCMDIDDALHARQLPNGNYEVGVHIADVSHFIKPGTTLDQEAANRGNTVYLVNKRIDMIPLLLGTKLCSLREKVDRLAFSCLWEMNADADIIRVNFVKSVICSKASLTYEEAQRRIDDPRMKDDLSESIRLLNKLAKKLHVKRLERGALTLASPEVRFQLENDSQDPVDVEMKELKETNALVEEFMLLANTSTAQKIISKFPASSLLRHHPPPSESKLEDLAQSISKFGFTLKYNTSKDLADSLNKAELPDEPYFNKLLRIMTTRCMMQAKYFCSGNFTEKDFLHYGLAAEIYTHFTSPIRRYSDIIVHRLLEACINPNSVYSDELTDKTKMQKLCEGLNYRHVMAQLAARSSVELHTNIFFKGKTEKEEGFVIRVVYSSLSSSKNSKTATPVVYNPRTNSLDSSLCDVNIKLFDKVTIQITIDEDLVGGMRQKLKIELLEPYIPGLSVNSNNVGKGSVRKSDDENRLSSNVKRMKINA